MGKLQRKNVNEMVSSIAVERAHAADVVDRIVGVVVVIAVAVDAEDEK